MNQWRFRINIFGKCVLQRLTHWVDDGHTYSDWRDANSADLHDYYRLVSRNEQFN